MNINEQIGQLFIIGFEGTEFSASIEKLIKETKIGGIILFSRNFNNIYQLIKLINDLQACSLEHQEQPLFISVDQEGGRVLRLGPPFTQFPPCANLGALNKEEETKSYARTLAKELKGCGINMDYAPVLDILTNKENTVIGDRAFGSDPEVVTRHGNIVIEEFIKQKLIPVGKHFPGHGGATEDSHFDLPEVDTEEKHLRNVETLPFQKAFNCGLEVIMTAHVKYHRMDPLYPATLSKTVLTGFLRRELGFKGLIITDDLEMKAVERDYSREEIAILSVLAGADCLLVCHSIEKQRTFIDGIITAVKENVISEKRIGESFEKIINLKERFLFPYREADEQEALKIFSVEN